MCCVALPVADELADGARQDDLNDSQSYIVLVLPVAMFCVCSARAAVGFAVVLLQKGRKSEHLNKRARATTDEMIVGATFCDSFCYVRKESATDSLNDSLLWSFKCSIQSIRI